jgi:hypothetical protein
MARLTSTTVPDASLRLLATLRPRGFGRFFIAAFLVLWLVGWAGGEVAAFSAAVVSASTLLLGESAHFSVTDLAAGAFLGVWLTGWTVGGVSAIAMLGKLVFGVEEILAGVGGLVVRSGFGPFRRERRVRRDTIFNVELTSNAVTVALVGEQWRVATLGTADERSALVEAINDAIGRNTVALNVARAREVPEPFTATDHDGELRLLRSARAWPLVVVMLPIAVFCALVLLRATQLQTFDDVPTTAAIAAGAVALALVGARRRDVGFIVRHATLHERTGLLLVRERPLPGALVVQRHVDSDGDERFELRCDSRVLLRANDAAACLHLGHYLAARTGTPLREDNA